MEISQSAKNEIKKNAKFLKITVESGGCSGFQYDLSYENDAKNFLIIDEIILTDAVSFEIIKEIFLDFKNELGYKEFSINNPLANSKCGCGNSFSL